MILSCNNGLKLEGLPFALDATRAVDFSYVSHAHADHCGRHKKILASAATAKLARVRFGKREFVTPPIGSPTEIAGVPVELCHAGHVLGSTQLRLRLAGRWVLYAGDLKPNGGRTAPPADTPDCDVLIVEATFGRPGFVFPPVEETLEKLVLAIKRAFVRGLTPVIMAYALGKAQEAIALLAGEGFQFACQRWVYEMVEVYRDCGIDLPGAELLDGDRLAGKVVILPPGHGSRREWKLVRNPFSIFLTGWALDNSRRNSADLVLPLSDHADFQQLLEFVKQTDPALVCTHHGYPEFAAILAEQGRQVCHLERGDAVDLLTGRKVNRQGSNDLFQNPA